MSSTAFRYNSLPWFCNWSTSIWISSRVTLSPRLILVLVFEPCPTRCRGPDEWKNWIQYWRRLRQWWLPFTLKHSPNRRPVPGAGPLQPKSSGCSEGSGELGCVFFLILTTLTFFFHLNFIFFFLTLFVLVYRMSTVKYLLQKKKIAIRKL